MAKAAAVLDYRALARRRLPPFLFEYLDGGSYAEVTLKRNVEILGQLALRQRVLADVSSIDLATTLFGQSQSLPVVLAPIGLAGMNARRGEVQAVRAANRAGVPFCLSTVGVCPLAEVAASSSAPFWFQLYMIRDRGLVVSLLDEARALGCSALVFIVDMPVPGSRYRDYRSGLAGAPGLRGAARRAGQALRHPHRAFDVGLQGRPHHLGNVAPALGSKTGLEDFLGWMRGNFASSITWANLAFTRQHWHGPLIIKGILVRPDLDHGDRSIDAGRLTGSA